MTLQLPARFRIGQQVIYKGNKHTITDVDDGYNVLHLDGHKYSHPTDPQNDGVVAPMQECKEVK